MVGSPINFADCLIGHPVNCAYCLIGSPVSWHCTGCRPGSALDAEALERATSIYLVDEVIPMLPRLLCEELCSLTPGADHLTFSIVWRLAAVRSPPGLWAQSVLGF